MSPEYALPDQKLKEVRDFLIIQRNFRGITSGKRFNADIFVAELNGEPIVIINKGLFKVKRTMHVGRDTADTFGEAGIALEQ